MSDFEAMEIDIETERVFAQGWDCGMRYYGEGRSLGDNPFCAGDERAVYFQMAFNRACWIDRDLSYLDEISRKYSGCA